MTPTLTLEEATRVFVAGFAFTRSFTHPYCCDTLPPSVWRLHDGPRRAGHYRGEEFVAFSVEPAELDTCARSHAQSGYSLCYLVPDGDSDEKARAGFKALGYRLGRTEPLMAHPLDSVAAAASPFPVVRVETAEQAAALAKATRRRPLPPELWKGEAPPLRQYIALDGETVIGWVGSVTVNGSAWCTNMFVEPRYRRRGIATALLSRMLHEDKAAGLAANVLLASHSGAKLYPTVGYRLLGTLLLYTPGRGGKKPATDNEIAES